MLNPFVFCSIDVYSDVVSNPTDVNVEKGARAALENGSDLIRVKPI